MPFTVVDPPVSIYLGDEGFVVPQFCPVNIGTNVNGHSIYLFVVVCVVREVGHVLMGNVAISLIIIYIVKFVRLFRALAIQNLKFLLMRVFRSQDALVIHTLWKLFQLNHPLEGTDSLVLVLQ